MNLTIPSLTFRIDLLILGIVLLLFICFILGLNCVTKNSFEVFVKIVKVLFDPEKDLGTKTKKITDIVTNGETKPYEESSYFLQNTKFSLDCCPGTFSNSVGCACLSKEQSKYLNERGGNAGVGEQG